MFEILDNLILLNTSILAYSSEGINEIKVSERAYWFLLSEIRNTNNKKFLSSVDINYESYFYYMGIKISKA